MWLYNIPGIAEYEDDMLAFWKYNQNDVLGKSFGIWTIHLFWITSE